MAYEGQCQLHLSTGSVGVWCYFIAEFSRVRLGSSHPQVLFILNDGVHSQCSQFITEFIRGTSEADKSF